MVLGSLVGYLWPQSADSLRPLGDLFIRTRAHDRRSDHFLHRRPWNRERRGAKRIGRVAIKTLIYFEDCHDGGAGARTSGGERLAPGAGMNIDPKTLEDRAVVDVEQQTSRSATASFSSASFRPARWARSRKAMSSPCCSSPSCSASRCWRSVRADEPIVDGMHAVSQVLFKMIAFAMYVAPIGAFGAMAFTVGRFGPRRCSRSATSC
jgi:aerobic C4-dicarboxylate transport protein